MPVVERDEVKHFAHAATNAWAVHSIDFAGCKIGSEVGEHAEGFVEVIAGKDYFGHDIAFVAIVLQGLLGTQVVEAVCTWAMSME